MSVDIAVRIDSVNNVRGSKKKVKKKKGERYG